MWSFCRFDAVVYNADKEIHAISNSFLKPKHDKFIENMANKHDTVAFDKLKFVVDNLDWKQFDDYECWFSIINSIVHTGFNNDYERKAELLCHEFSEQSPKYKAHQLDKLISSLNINAFYTFGTLCYYLKECNPDKFKLRYPKRTYSFVKEEFELRNLKILNPPCYISFVEDDTTNSYTILSQSKIIEKYRNVWYIKEGDKDVNKPFISDWLNDCNIKPYSLMDFIPYPMVCPEHVFNLWNGFAIDKCEVEPNEDCSIMIEHISMLCNHDKAATDYMIKWLAHII